MTVRLAKVSDAGDIYRIHTSAIREICSKYYKEDEIKQWIQRQNEQRYISYIEKKEVYIVEDDEQTVLGFGHLAENDEKKLEANQDSVENKDHWKAGEIRALYVQPGHIRNGIGQTLLKHMEDKAKGKQARELIVFSTLNAISFYKRFRFEVVGEMKQCGQGVNLQCTKLVKRIQQKLN